MNDIKNLLIYGGLTLAVILGLVISAEFGIITHDTIGILAIIFVVIVPIFVAVKLGNKEREREDNKLNK